jgi:hypothetical protein
MSIARIVITTEDTTNDTLFSIEGDEGTEAYMNAEDILMMIAEDQGVEEDETATYLH